MNSIISIKDYVIILENFNKGLLYYFELFPTDDYLSHYFEYKINPKDFSQFNKTIISKIMSSSFVEIKRFIFNRYLISLFKYLR